MDLFKRNVTVEEQRELDALRSQINIARRTLDQRLENGLNQTELARLAGTTQARVSEIEAMKGDPRLSTLGRVALALGCMIDMVPIAPEVTTTPKGYSALASNDWQVSAPGNGGNWGGTAVALPVRVEQYG